MSADSKHLRAKNSLRYKDEHKDIERDDKIYKIVAVVIYVLFFLMFTELFYRQSIEYNGQYNSDLDMHIVLCDRYAFGYSLMYPIFRVLKHINGTYFYVAMFLSACVCLTFYFTQKIFKMLMPNVLRIKNLLLALAVNIVSNIYIPALNPYRYTNVGTPNVWHNSSYILMKLGITVFLIFLIHLMNEIPGKINLNHWLGGTATLLLTTSLKPNFLLCFAPALLVFLIISFIRNRFKDFKNHFILALIVIPSMIVLLYQYIAMFGESSSTESALAIGLAPFIGKRFIFGVFQLIAFPLFIFICEGRRFFSNKLHLISVLTYLFGLFEAVFLYETGPRMNHGNWLWGYYSTTFVLFVVTLPTYIQMLRDTSKSKKFRIACGVIGGALFVLHLFWGVVHLYGSVLGWDYNKT